MTTTTPKKRGRPAKPRPNALASTEQEVSLTEAPESLPEQRSAPTLDLTLPDLKIMVEAMLAMPSTPDNVDVYYKVETYRQALKEHLK